jgi:hypothetical protein
VRIAVLLAVVSLGLCTTTLQAQGQYYPGGGQGTRPAYSPYLNLLRGGGTTIQNYEGLVRPEVNFRNSLQQLDAQQALAGAQQNALENALTLPATGHASRFLSHSRYFLNSAGGQGFGGQLGAPAGPAPGAAGAQAAPPSRGGR